MTVTTGARGACWVSVSTTGVAASSSPYWETNSTPKPNSSATVTIESLSRRLFMVAIRPSRMQVAMTSWGLTSIRFASSARVMNSCARMTLRASVATSPFSSSRRWWRRLAPPVSRLASVLRTLSSTSFSSTTFFFLRSRRLRPGEPGPGGRWAGWPGACPATPAEGPRSGPRPGAGRAPGRAGCPGVAGAAGADALADGAWPACAAWAAAVRARSSRARCTSCSCLRVISSRTAVRSCAISACTRSTVSGSRVLMWFLTSTPSRRTIWSTASLDIPRSFATS